MFIFKPYLSYFFSSVLCCTLINFITHLRYVLKYKTSANLMFGFHRVVLRTLGLDWFKVFAALITFAETGISFPTL